MTFFNPQPGAAPGSVTNREVLAFVWSFWMKRRRTFALACVLTLVWTGLDLSLPMASSRLIAAVAPLPADAPRAWLAWRAYLLLFAAYAIVRNVAFRLWARIAAFNMEAMTNEVFGRLQAAPAEWHANHAGGETIRRVVRAMWGYDAVTDAFTIWLVPSLVVLVGLCVALCWREPVAGLVALGVVCVFVTGSVLLTVRYVRPANLLSNRRDGLLSGMLNDSLGANGAVKSFAAEPREAARIAGATAAWRASILITWNRFIDMGLLQNLCLLALLAGLSAAMLNAWTHARADAGDIAFAITSFLVMSGYLRNVGENVRQLQRGFDDVSDAVALRHERSEDVAPMNDESPLTRGRIVFDDVGFAYPGAKRAICEHLNVSIEPGEIVAVMGPSGTGKSTLVKLLQRLYEPRHGRIAIDGVDTATVPLNALRGAIAVAAQQPDLFHRTVFDNIAYARPDASRAEVEDAARAAHADRFIAALPDGYDTMVGERGVKLSGGQRQRIALARALLADAPIVVLDEATSALDAHTEQAVLAGLRERLAGRTCLFITHRPSAARFADRVLHFADGRLAEGPLAADSLHAASPGARPNGAPRYEHDTASAA
ncbi:ABC transporter ATP-binding protein [Paraburkholderia caballeronis]|uniref:ABC transporter ATP-binding protein n=1 Tax=Paraburkholderia caballeronis TaxID=416943 RepID=UPI0010654840|nr:ABC transporter ATP-binding protein [Paraburkholderia caballeronis]TDV03062.1 ATP-binding cassette subfamily B protein [Paraburkholderia caballeronis]TDV08384.1 ATP-binding cassette subfamily B protein [Paraburkholderia caballeronis]TDV19741.1 ATP-binding cassette subfamily B protein [Paraburkholderia caballeronis]